MLGNGTVIDEVAASEAVTRGAVVWEGERIVAVGSEAELRRRYPDARFLDAHGGLILPGLVNLHHHFYSALARGLDPGTPMRTFPQVLDRLWWRLDRALDAETVRLSALLSAAECARWGCTTVFDHHASPTALAGSLDEVAAAIEEVGLSAVLCYEVTDRNGHEGALAGFAENLRFAEAHRDDARIRGLVGLHASFTLRDETLAEVAARRPKDCGVHIHLAEDPVDGEASRAAFGAGPIERLERFGLLDERTILAHGIHLAPADYERIGRSGAVLVHNPESNANNGVGRLDPLIAAEHGCRVGLGTDGMSSAMLRSLRAAFLALRGGRRDPSVGFSVLPDLLATNAAAAAERFGEPLLGRLEPGAPADLCVFDAPPPTPINLKTSSPTSSTVPRRPRSVIRLRADGCCWRTSASPRSTSSRWPPARASGRPSCGGASTRWSGARPIWERTRDVGAVGSGCQPVLGGYLR